MPLSEFSLIEKYFLHKTPQRQDVVLGIGDDAAIVTSPCSKQLVTAMDTLVSGVHFPEDWPAAVIGYRALAVNLSDMAAMGALPAWLMLSLTLPNLDEQWLSEYSEAMFQLVTQHKMQLIGGDISKGPLSMTLALYGFVAENKALCRHGAQAGDVIYVTGELGVAALAFKAWRDPGLLSAADRDYVLQKWQKPIARIKEGQALVDVANSAIDISDGLAADLQHILQASQVAAVLDLQCLPIADLLTQTLPLDIAQQLALSYGDDYELCFTVAAEFTTEVERRLQNLGCRCTAIGRIVEGLGLFYSTEKSSKLPLAATGFKHF